MDMTELDEKTKPLTNGINGDVNGHSEPMNESTKHRESSEERRNRKYKERKAKENETEEERTLRREREKKSREERHKSETEEERRSRKERESKEKRRETEDERALRKERERKEREERHRNETEQERQVRKERERKEKEERGRNETEEERKIRKEKEKREGKDRKNETDEERLARKERERRERDDRKKHETEEERSARKERERKEREDRKHETEEERRIRKDKERRERDRKKEIEKQERKDRERLEKGTLKKEMKDEPMELGDDYFAQEEARLAMKSEIKDYVQETDAIKEEVAQDESFDGEKQDIDSNVMNEESDEDVPLARRKPTKIKKRKMQSEDDSDEEPLSKKKAKAKKLRKKSDDEDDFKPTKKKPKVEKKLLTSPTKKQTKKEKELEEEKKVWKWWEESEQLPEGVKWRFLEHKGPLFAPNYEPLPEDVRFWYDGKVMKLRPDVEEAATFYGKMLDHDYTTKEVFNKNFFKDWRKLMTEKEKGIIRDLQKCDFSEINEHFKKLSEERKNRTKEEKKAEKERNEKIVEEFGFCDIDGHKEKIGNFRTEPPSLFRGRGEHPKQGMIKRRIMPEDVIINCSKNSNVPEPPSGHKWKKVQHDNAVTWLASWTENIQGQIKYIMLNPSSKLKGEKDWQKYEKARKLKDKIDQIREDYLQDLRSKEMRVRQRAVALYFIDKLALRAGNEKDDDQADTVGCCSLRFEHLELHEEQDGKEFVVEFDFLGKDSIRYQNTVAVEKKVFKNLKLFMENKKPGDDLFDRLNTTILNQYLNSLMDGLTAKVFRTYNASFTLQQQLDKLTTDNDQIQAKMLSYNRANRAVAILCNHQRAVPKTFEKSMENINAKIDAKQEAIKDAQKQLKTAKKSYKNGGPATEKGIVDKKKKALERLLEQLEKLEIQKTDRDENKTIALGTSKLNYLDPRISVAWCKKHDVPIEKVYNKTQREKFRWAIDMAEADFVF